MAVGVVVGRALAEVAEPAHRARGRRAAGTRAPAGSSSARRSSWRRPGSRQALEARQLERRVDEVVVRPRAVEHQRAGRGRSAARRAPAGAAGAKNGASFLVAGLEALTSGSRSSSVERRFTNVVLPRRSVVGSSASARESDVFSAAIAAGGGVRVADERRQVVAARGDRRDRARGVDDEVAVSAPSSRVDLVDQPARARQHRVEVLVDWPACLPLPVVLGGEALDHALQRLARLRVERVEELVEVDRRRRLVGAERRAVGELRARCSGPGVSAT